MLNVSLFKVQVSRGNEVQESKTMAFPNQTIPSYFAEGGVKKFFAEKSDFCAYKNSIKSVNIVINKTNFSDVSLLGIG